MLERREGGQEMSRRLRTLVVLTSAFALVLVLNVGTAFAHGNGNSTTTFPGAVNNNGPVLGPIDPLFFNGAFDQVNANAIPGIVQGFTLHSPMCTDHYDTEGHVLGPGP